ncbi:hypothetical protein Bealeia1_01446 [Candidatus Bealeia paramacronuclearis]|uniref:Secreted protein n=1 Tax=Candidatus Bealeia paramacronuclearis TaxID=1921001 RepID=A0ABZ2C5B4_9PROT|nr:hypothetical protein [Candidatus Bealeia paramacronuclearis]
MNKLFLISRKKRLAVVAFSFLVFLEGTAKAAPAASLGGKTPSPQDYLWTAQVKNDTDVSIFCQIIDTTHAPTYGPNQPCVYVEADVEANTSHNFYLPAKECPTPWTLEPNPNTIRVDCYDGETIHNDHYDVPSKSVIVVTAPL